MSVSLTSGQPRGVGRCFCRGPLNTGFVGIWIATVIVQMFHLILDQFKFATVFVNVNVTTVHLFR